MPFVREKDREDLWRWMNNNGRPTSKPLKYVSESIWQEYLFANPKEDSEKE